MILYFPDGTQYEVVEKDTSYRYRAIMGDDAITLYFDTAEFTEVPVGTYVEYQGEKYTLTTPQKIEKNGTRQFSFTLTLESAAANLKKYIVRNPIDNRIDFPYTAQPQEHLQLIVDNLNMRESGWSVGEYAATTEHVITYSQTTVYAALQAIATEFDTEFEIDGKTIHLRKVEYFKDKPLPLSYGKGKGLIPGVGRTNESDERPAEILYVQGGEQNIDSSTYGSTTLHLPAGQTLDYEGRQYKVSDDGLSIQRADKSIQYGNESCIELSDIYPKRVGEVTAVETEEETDDDGNTTTLYNIIDSTIPAALDYSACQIAGQTMTVIFQTGMLTGKEFQIQTDSDGNLTGYEHEARRFKLCQTTMDGMVMPGGSYVPKVGDKYACFYCSLPQAYIRDDATQSGAEWDLFKEAVKTLYENEDQKFTFSGTLNSVYSRQNWLQIGGYLKLGAYIRFTDEQFQTDPVDIRITGIKDYLRKPYSPELELSTGCVSASGFASTVLQAVKETETTIKQQSTKLNQLLKRSIWDVKEAMVMIKEDFGEDAVLEKTQIVVSAGDMYQFEFVDSKTDPQNVVTITPYINDDDTIDIDASILKHYTLGINTVSSEHDVTQNKYWDVESYVSPVLEAAKVYRVYVKANQSGEDATYYLQDNSEALKACTNSDGYYYFLMGYLGKLRDGQRAYSRMHGYTEILPGQITTRYISDPNGNFTADLSTGEVTVKKLTIASGSSVGYENLTDKPDLSKYETVADFTVKYNSISSQVTKINTANTNNESAITALQSWKDAAATQITANQNNIYAVQTAGYITKAEGNTLYAAAADMNGKTIASLITQTPEAISLISKNINLQGLVTFSSFSSDLQNTINGKADTTAVNTAVNNVKTQIESKGYLTSVDWGNLSGVTAITGGFTISEHLVCKNLHVTSDDANEIYAQIGNFQIRNDWLYAKTDTSKIALGKDIAPAVAGGSFTQTAAIINYQKTGSKLFNGTAYALQVRAEGDRANGQFSVGLLCEGSLQLRGGLSAIRAAAYNVKPGNDLKYLDTYIFQQNTDTSVTLPTTTEIQSWFPSYLADSTHISSTVLTLQIIVTRYATAKLVVQGDSSTPLIKKDGSTGYKIFTKGQSGQFTYYNGAWYCTSLRNG